MEILVLENMKKLGYELWPQKLPVTRKHIDLVVKKYAQFHATSVAMKEQKPEEFQKFVDFLTREPNPKKSINLETLLAKPIQLSYELLKDDFDEDILLKWRNLKEQLTTIVGRGEDGLRVIIHGDFWNNNFLYYYQDINNKVPLEVAILDWQWCRYGSPIKKIYLTSFSPADLKTFFESLDEILLMYHNAFDDHLEKMNVANPEKVYSVEQFLNDWKTYSMSGILTSAVTTRMVCIAANELPDLAKVVESGKNFSDAFLIET